MKPTIPIPGGVGSAAPLNPYHRLAIDYARLIKESRGYALGGFPKCTRPNVAPHAPKVLIFAPHPDDEVITGGLALRLLREAKWNVINVAVTLGSEEERRAERLAELKACCDFIGFGLMQTAPNGLQNVNAKTREQEPTRWTRSAEIIADILAEHRPRVIFFPHQHDWNRTHVGTHFLVLDALKCLPANFGCYTVETEFWGAMESPNLMVEVRPLELGDLTAALTYHAGEVKRNPFHLSLPTWMVDNVRRGSELVCGQGGAAPDFPFATLYRLRRWTHGNFEAVFEAGRILGATENPANLFAP